MNDKQETLTIIGRAERIAFLELNIKSVPAKVDTGADTSSVWAGSVVLKDDDLHVVFFSPESEFYTGTTHVFPKNTYSVTRISNSFGHKEIRYKLKLKVKIKKRVVRATFTLSDRSQKLYPVLLGRKLLNGKFLVDVQKGKPLRAAEMARSEQLKAELNNIRGEL